jgi:RES domain-containing protein
MRAPARWHRAGNAVVYCAENPASALLEICAHTAADDVPATYTLLQIEGPDVEVATLPEGVLPPDWPGQPELTQSIGTAWLTGVSEVLLRVPSVIVPHTSHFLFNPRHVLAKEFVIIEAIDYPFDVRIKQ